MPFFTQLEIGAAIAIFVVVAVFVFYRCPSFVLGECIRIYPRDASKQE